jgi:3-dehydroquinate synthase
VRKHFESAGLPTRLSDIGVSGIGERLARHMEHDKKRASGRTAFILVRGIGDAYVDKQVELAEVAEFLDGAR